MMLFRSRYRLLCTVYITIFATRTQFLVRTSQIQVLDPPLSNLEASNFQDNCKNMFWEKSKLLRASRPCRCPAQRWKNRNKSYAKVTGLPSKKASNIPEIYAKMFGRFHWLLFVTFYLKILGNVEDIDVWNFRQKWFMWPQFRQWRKNFGFGSALFTQFCRWKYGFVYCSNVQRTFKDGKIKSTVFTRSHAMKRHKIMLPMSRKREISFIYLYIHTTTSTRQSVAIPVEVKMGMI